MATAARACTVLGLAVAPLFTGLPAAHAETFYRVETSATAIHVTATQQPASSIVTASLLDDAVAYASSGFDSGGSSDALAAPAFPGRLVVQGPQLLCTQLFSCPVSPPDYPLLAEASYPRQRHDAAQLNGRPMGAGPFVVTPLRATARASASANHATTRAGQADLLAGTPGTVTVGASAATTAVTSTDRQTVVTVTADANDITIAGLVHIASVRSVDRVVVAAGRTPGSHPQVTITGVTVAGQAASIDDSGLHLAGVGSDHLIRAITRRGVTIRAIGVERHRSRTATHSQAIGLAIDVALPVDGVPYIPNPLPPLPPPFDQVPALPGVNANGTYVAHISIGAVGAAAGVGRQPAFDLGGPATNGGSAPAAGSGRGTRPVGPPLGGNDLVRSLATPATATPSLAGPPSVVRGLVDRISAAQLETLYAVLALGSLALFIGWRAAVMVRTGRSR